MQLEGEGAALDSYQAAPRGGTVGRTKSGADWSGLIGDDAHAFQSQVLNRG